MFEALKLHFVHFNWTADTIKLKKKIAKTLDGFFTSGVQLPDILLSAYEPASKDSSLEKLHQQPFFHSFSQQLCQSRPSQVNLFLLYGCLCESVC